MQIVFKMDQFGYAKLFDRSKLRHNKDMDIELSNFDDLMITKMCILSGMLRGSSFGSSLSFCVGCAWTGCNVAMLGCEQSTRA